MSKQSLSEELWNGLGDAITDIRQKVIEEPTYGRAVTDGPERFQWPDPQDQQPSFASRTHSREVSPDPNVDLDR